MKSKRFSEIAMVKGFLTVLLPLVVDKVIDVNFGASRSEHENGDALKPSSGEHAFPYNGNCSQKEGSFICSPFEAIIKTHFMLLKQGLNRTQVKNLLNIYMKLAVKEAKEKNIPLNQTRAASEFAAICPGLDLTKLDINEIRTIPDRIRMNPTAILTYAREQVSRQIKYWPENLRSNAQNFSAMFDSQIFSTGTPYNSGVYPANLKMMNDPGTIGEALHIINQKCPKDGIHNLQSSNPIDLLDETLNTFFKGQTNFTALIDGGAQLTGLNTEFVARRMAAFAAQHRPDIKAIDFFIRDRLVSLEVATLTIDDHAKCRIPLEQRLSYFDQVHGFAANVPQKSNGKGLLLLGPDHNLFQMLQEVFRMRGVKIFKQLAGIGDETISPEEISEANMNETQTIHFALTPQTRKVLSPQATLQDIIEMAAKNEDEATKMRNYRAFSTKVHNVIRRAVLDKIYACNNLSEMLALFKEFKELLVWKVEDDPKKLFGLIESLKPTNEVLKATCKNAYSKIEKSRSFNQEEKSRIKKEISEIPLPPMPEKVSVFTEGKKIRNDLAEDIGKEIALAVDQEVDNENENDENENENENENEVNQRMNNQATSSKYQEWGWSDQINPYSTGWMHFTSPIAGGFSTMASAIRTVFGYFTFNNSPENLTPPLFKAKELLSANPMEEMSGIASYIDERIWFSNNFLPRKHKEFNGTTGQIGSRSQRELFEVLIYVNENNQVVSVGCLSQKDMAAWRKKLKNRHPEGALQVALYDMQLRKVVAGDQIDLTKLKKNKDFLLLESQLKYLNGDESYLDDQKETLTEWIEKSDIEKLQNAFNAIHNERGKKTLSGTDIDWIFDELRLKNLEPIQNLQI